MAKGFKVGDTTYQFPDSYSDEQVQGILTKQGIIKSKKSGPLSWIDKAYGYKSPEERDASFEKKRELKANDSRGMDEFGGAMIMPLARPGIAAVAAGAGAKGAAQAFGKAATDAATQAVGGAAVGFGARKLAKEIGVPEEFADVVGVVAGMWGVSAARNLKEFLATTEKPDTWKFAKWMSDRGKSLGKPKMADPYKGKSWGQGTSTPYGGPTEPGYSEPNPMPKATPATVQPINGPKSERFTPNPRTAAKMRYGGAAEEYGGPSYQPSPKGRLKPPTGASTGEPTAQATESTASTPKNPQRAGTQQRGGAGGQLARYQDRIAKALADHVKAKGIKPSSAADWQGIAKAAGYDGKASADIIQKAQAMLGGG